MRLILGLLMVVGFFHGFYSVSMAVSSYFSLYDAVDRAVAEHGRTGMTAVVRDGVLRRASAAGVTLDDRRLFVEEDGRVLVVRIRWSYPVLTIQGEPVLVIPLAIDRTFPR